MVITMQLLLSNQCDLIVQLQETTKGEKKLELLGKAMKVNDFYHICFTNAISVCFPFLWDQPCHTATFSPLDLTMFEISFECRKDLVQMPQ